MVAQKAPLQTPEEAAYIFCCLYRRPNIQPLRSARPCMMMALAALDPARGKGLRGNKSRDERGAHVTRTSRRSRSLGYPGHPSHLAHLALLAPRKQMPPRASIHACMAALTIFVCNKCGFPLVGGEKYPLSHAYDGYPRTDRGVNARRFLKFEFGTIRASLKLLQSRLMPLTACYFRRLCPCLLLAACCSQLALFDSNRRSKRAHTTSPAHCLPSLLCCSPQPAQRCCIRSLLNAAAPAILPPRTLTKMIARCI